MNDESTIFAPVKPKKAPPPPEIQIAAESYIRESSKFKKQAEKVAKAMQKAAQKAVRTQRREKDDDEVSRAEAMGLGGGSKSSGRHSPAPSAKAKRRRKSKVAKMRAMNGGFGARGKQTARGTLGIE